MNEILLDESRQNVSYKFECVFSDLHPIWTQTYRHMMLGSWLLEKTSNVVPNSYAFLMYIEAFYQQWTKL